MKMRSCSVAMTALLLLAGCSAFSLFGPQEPPAPQVLTPEALDLTTPEQKAAAVSAAEAQGQAQGRDLGRVVVALGNPVQPGFWLKTPLVGAPVPGRVEVPGGAVVAVTLLPIDGGGGAQMSLAAYRALGLSLTDLPEVRVYAD